MGVRDRLAHAWNAFTSQNAPDYRTSYEEYGPSYGARPDRIRRFVSNEKSMITSILTRISIDVAGVDIRHVKTDENGRYLEDVKSGINECLTVGANIDQPARHFRQDMALTMFDKGVIAIVPVDTTINPAESASYDIQSMRVGEVVAWYPSKVRVEVYNEKRGVREQLVLDKKHVAIVENPLYPVMNEPNSTLQRLMRKLNVLDEIDSVGGKLDIIIQVPYAIKSEARRADAIRRRKEVEFQLSGSKYGVAYADATEKITQLNRPAENQLMAQVEYLTVMLYSQLGVTKEVMEGTADEAAMLNYRNRTLEPVLDALVESMRRTFLTKTARTQGHSIMYFQNPFKLIPIAQIAEIADKFTRNEITAANEIRQVIGFKPSKDPKADELRNSNMPAPSPSGPDTSTPATQEGDSQNGS